MSKRHEVCDKSPTKKHEWVRVGRPIPNGILYYHVCKHCKKPEVFDFKGNGQHYEHPGIVGERMNLDD